MAKMARATSTSSKVKAEFRFRKADTGNRRVQSSASQATHRGDSTFRCPASAVRYPAPPIRYPVSDIRNPRFILAPSLFRARGRTSMDCLLYTSDAADEEDS